MLGLSNIIVDLIQNATPCDINIFQDGSLTTLADCIIKKQDGLMVEFEYPYNNKTYVYPLSEIQSIRWDTS